MNIRYSRRALRQLDDIFAFVAGEDPRVAKALVSRVEALGDLIARHPTMGRPTDLEGVRVFRIAPYPYLLFYRAAPDSVTVLSLRHTSRAQNCKKGR